MNLIKFISRILLIVPLFLVLNACLEQTENTQVAYGDAFIKCYRQGDSVLYGVEFFTYSWHSMIDVEVYSDNRKHSTVLDTFESKYTFAYQPSKSNYSVTIPSANKYTFNVLFEDGNTYSSVDYLDTLVIDPPIVTELLFDDVKNSFYIKWDNVKNAQYYSVILINENNNIAFESELLDRSEIQIWINHYSKGWRIDQKPTANTKYQIAVNAYLFEPAATTFDIQCISVNNQFKIEWLVN